MSFTTNLIFVAVAAWLIKRSWSAVAGPLSHVPGSFHSRFATLVYMYHIVLGTVPAYADTLFAKYGPVVRVGPGWVITGGRDAVNHVILVDDLPKSVLYERSSTKVHRSLISERNNVDYKKRRKLISHGFSPAYLSGLEPLFQECVKDMTDLLYRECKAAEMAGRTAVVDIYNILSNLTSDVITSTSLGGSMHAVRSNNDSFKTLVLQNLKESVLRIVIAPLRYMNFGPFKRSTTVDDLVKSIVAKRREDLEAKAPLKKDMLQMLLDAQKIDPIMFPDGQVYEELMLFFLAGSDTSSTTAFLGLLRLLKNPDKLQRLVQELDMHLANGGDFGFESTANLAYLNAVIQETLRLCFVALGGLSRETREPTVLNDIPIPKNITISAYISVPAKDQKLWPNADDFLPERWLDDFEGKPPDKKAFHPFSGGLRSCIGKDFAIKELRLIFAHLLAKFEFEMIPGEPEVMRFHVVPYLKGVRYRLKVKSRGANSSP